MIFSKLMLDQMNKIHNEVNNIVTEEDLKSSLKNMAVLLEQQPIVQAIDLIGEKIKQSLIRLHELREAILYDFNAIEEKMTIELDDPATKPWFESSRKKDDQVGFPFFKKSMLIETWQHFVVEKDLQEMDQRMSLPKALWRDQYEKESRAIVGKGIEPWFRTSNVIGWEREYAKHKEMEQVLLDINYIKKCYKNLNLVNSKKLKVAMQNVCSYLSDMIDSGVGLNVLKIENITYVYSKGGNPPLKLFINGSNPLPIRDDRAKRLHILLKKPWSQVEFTDNSAKNNVLRKGFDDINCSTSAAWHRYGFGHGLYNLVKSDGYSHGISREIAHLIQKKI